MPDNHPTPHNPETWSDRFYSHPEVVVSILGVITGVVLLINSIFNLGVLPILPFHLGVPLGAVLAVSSLLATLGILVRKLRHLEQYGWHVLVTTSVLLAVTIAQNHQQHSDHLYLLAMGLLSTLISVGVIRSIALALIRKSARRINVARASRGVS